MKRRIVVWMVLLGLLGVQCSDDTPAGSDGSTDTHEGDTGSDTATLTDTDSGPVFTYTWYLHQELLTLIYVTWRQEVKGPAYVAYRFEGKEWHKTPTKLFDAGNAKQLVLGVPYDTSVELRVVNIVEEEPVPMEILKATTGAIPLPELQPDIDAAIPDQWDPADKYLIGSINATEEGWSPGEYWMFILDRQGRVVWAYRTPLEYFSYYVRVSHDTNDLLWDEISYWTDWDDGKASVIHRMKIDGTIKKTYPIPGANHAFTEIDDETFAWWGLLGGGQLLLREPGERPEAIWSCPDFFEENGLAGSCLANTVYYRESTDSFLVSFALMDFIVEVDRQTGDTLKRFGAVQGAYSFSPPESAFDMNHGVTYTDAGTLLVSTHTDWVSDEAIIREYELDTESKVLTEIWNFGIGDNIWAPYGGEAHRLAGGNTIQNYGVVPRFREIAPAGEVVWDLSWSLPGMIGRTIFLEDLYVFDPN